VKTDFTMNWLLQPKSEVPQKLHKAQW